jgi:1-acyl-sn-glycerol-3-phosphate acyltransferase
MWQYAKIQCRAPDFLDARRGKLMYWVFKGTVLTALRIWYRPKVTRDTNLPRGPAIIASNHLSFSDSFFLGAVISRKLTFMAKSSYFDSPGVKGWLMARFFSGLGQIPVDRTGGSASLAALDDAAQILRHGGLLGIYPEGTRSPDGRLYRGRTGIARLALTTGVPVIPVAVIGTREIQPPSAVMPRRAAVSIRIGSPLNFSDAELSAENGAARRRVTDEIMREIQRLSGQEYVNSYSPGPRGQA